VDAIGSSRADAAPAPDDGAWQAALRERLATERFSGTVLIVRGDTRVFAGAFGLADRERGVANRLSTRFRYGSVGKLFTAVAVVQLVQAGRVDLAAPVGTYLTRYPNPDLATRVTVSHLLSHSGGTGDIFVPGYMERRAEVRTVDDYLALFGERGVEFEPGSRFAYSNYGFILLGAVIEAVTGRSYYDHVDEHVYAPAGMDRTGALPEESAVPDLAAGYTNEVEGTGRNTDTLPYRGTPAGGGYSTVEDLCRFAGALAGHRLLDAGHTRLITGDPTDVAWGADGRLGYFERPTYAARSFGAAGGAPGMSADLVAFPASGLTIAALANTDPPVAQDVCMSASYRLFVPRPVPAERLSRGGR
jgi:CubicO group peptidase (beta-lactamase class C family)